MQTTPIEADDTHGGHRRTKIVATIGPRTNSPELIRQLVDAGMNMARLNGAHADPAWHAATIACLRETAPEIPILLDLPGSKVRIVQLEHEPTVAIGDRVIFTTSLEHTGAEKVPVDAPINTSILAVGDQLTAEDGALIFTIQEMAGEDVICRAETAGTLQSRKGISLPSSSEETGVSPRDHELIGFAAEHGVDFVGLSFVSSAAHVEDAKRVAGPGGPRIIAKIENQPGLEHLEEIVEVADGLLIDRGDLSVQTSLESLVMSQKRILKVAADSARPVIVATEMLHTMIENPLPTKAEVSDIANAVLDGASAVMLSGETAIGKHPVKAVDLMRRVVMAADHHHQSTLEQAFEDDARRSIPLAITDALASITRRFPVTKIVAITIAGYAARMAAATRPSQPILAVSNDAVAARSFNLLPGTEGVHVDIPFSRQSADHIAACLKVLWTRGKVVDDDIVLVTSLKYPTSGNRMNMIQLHRIGDLSEALKWKDDWAVKMA